VGEEADILINRMMGFGRTHFTTKRNPITSYMCKGCGKDSLHWKQITVGWRLFDDSDTMHTCSGFKR